MTVIQDFDKAFYRKYRKYFDSYKKMNLQHMRKSKSLNNNTSNKDLKNDNIANAAERS